MCGDVDAMLCSQVQQHQQAVEAAKAEAQAAQQELDDLTQKHDELYAQIGSYKQHIDDLTEVMDSTEAARAAAVQESVDLRSATVLCVILMPCLMQERCCTCCMHTMLKSNMCCRQALEDAQAAAAAETQQLAQLSQQAEQREAALQQQACIPTFCLLQVQARVHVWCSSMTAEALQLRSGKSGVLKAQYHQCSCLDVGHRDVLSCICK